MKAKYFHAWFCVRIIGGFEAQFVDTHFAVEYFHETNEAAKSEAVIGYDALDLVELCQMSGIDGLVAKNSID